MTSPENTTAADQSTSISGYWWLVLFVFVTAFYLFGLTIPLVGPDESRYAQVAREMFERGDWISPTLGGYLWFEKPALLYWLQIAAYYLFGVNEFAARFGSALCGLGTIASLWILGRFASGGAPKDAANFANWLALIAASTLGIVVFSRAASFDIIVTFPLTAALVSFFAYERARQNISKERGLPAPLPLVAFYIFIGLAVMAKGLIGIAFPVAAIALFFLFARRRPSRQFLISLLWGTILAAAIAAVWYLPMYIRHGYEFIDEFFVQHHFQRFISNKYRHPQPFYFYLWVLPLMTLPWLPFFLAGIVAETRRVFARSKKIQREPPEIISLSNELFLFSLAWLIVPLVFFSVSGSKLPGYILPAVPAAVVIAAIHIHGLVEHSRIWRRSLLLVTASTFIGLTLALVFTVPRFAEGDSVKSLVAAADARGHASRQILMLHTISHNAEFYAAGRLLRDEVGRQIRLSSNSDLVKAIDGGSGVVVLVPMEYVANMTSDPRLVSEVIANNGELAIAFVTVRKSPRGGPTDPIH